MGETESTVIAGKRILTIDDSRAIRVFLVQLLTEYAAELDEAGTGAEALALFDAGKRYDIVLLDLVLPDIDGFDLLKQIRAIDQETTIIMLTGVGSIKSATSAVRAGADGYVEKQHLVAGHDENELLYALQQSLEHRAGWIARQQLDEVRAEFYSMVTHDLRNPAGNVAASLKLLLSGKPGKLTERQSQLLDVANRSARKLLNLIDDYLDFSKIDAGYLRLDRRAADIRDVLQGTVEQNMPQALARGHKLELELPNEAVQAVVDPERLEQVFDNLITNAIKYTPDGGRVSVRLETGGGMATITIADSGRGLSAEALPSLFTKYNRVPGEATRGVTGTGLGLLIVKEIVMAHGGDVRAESGGKDRGTTFIVSIPLSEI